jgi:hypothetical protein
MTPEEMYNYHTQKLNEIPEDFLIKVVNFLKQDMSDKLKKQIWEAYEKDGYDWYRGTHFGWGMAMRNRLRTAEFLDDQLPEKNWDDYYIACIELAVGIRDTKKIPKEKFSKKFWFNLWWKENVVYKWADIKYKYFKQRS